MNHQATETPDEVGAKPVQTAPEDPAAVASQNVGKPPRAWSSLRRDLSAEDLANPGVQKLLLDHVENLMQEKSELETYRSSYQTELLKSTGLQARLDTKTREEILSGIALTAGSALLGFVPNIWANQPTAGLLTALAVILVAASIFAKAIK